MNRVGSGDNRGKSWISTVNLIPAIFLSCMLLFSLWGSEK